MGWLFRCVFFPHHCLPPHDPHSPSYKPTPKGHLFTRPAHYVIINIFIDLTTSAGTQLIWWLKWWRAEIVSKGFTVGERGFGASTESRLELRSVKAFTERNKNMEPVAKRKEKKRKEKKHTLNTTAVTLSWYTTESPVSVTLTLFVARRKSESARGQTNLLPTRPLNDLFSSPSCPVVFTGLLPQFRILLSG